MRNRLREGELSARRPYFGCVLGRRHRVNRVNWTRTHQRWLRQQWNNVLFSGESRFTIHRGNSRVRVYRRRNERYADCCVLERDRFWDGGSVLIWANITLYQHDNATNHAARDTVNFLRANNIAFINDWPAKNTDLNPIGHLWDNLDQSVRRRPIPPLNVI